MKARSFTLAIAAVVGAFALFATPAEAGGYRKCYRHGYYRGGWSNYGYYHRRHYYRPVRYGYYRPVRYVRAPYYYPGPAFQIGFSFGGYPYYGW